MDDMDCFIPSRLNDKPKFLWWDLDVAAIWLLSLPIGVATGYILPSMALFVFPAFAYARAKSGKHPGFARHLVYWHLGLSPFNATPPSSVREFLG